MYDGILSMYRQFGELSQMNPAQMSTHVGKIVELVQLSNKMWLEIMASGTADTAKTMGAFMACRSPMDVVDVQRRLVETSSARTLANLQIFMELTGVLVSGLAMAVPPAAAAPAYAPPAPAIPEPATVQTGVSTARSTDEPVVPAAAVPPAKPTGRTPSRARATDVKAPDAGKVDGALVPPETAAVPADPPASVSTKTTVRSRKAATAG